MASTPLRIATLNVWGLPLGLARHAGPRFAAIAQRLPDLELDAIGFQEVWTPEARDALLAGGLRAGLVHAWHRAGRTDRGGLMLLSRHPIEDVRFHAYRLRGLPENLHHGDYHSGKGFVLARLRTPGGALALANTHLLAQYAPPERDAYHPHRMGQVLELALALRGMDGPLAAVGDFNMREGQPEYALFRALTGLVDVAAQLHQRAPTASLTRSPYTTRGAWDTDARIDYVFARAGAPRATDARRIFAAPLDFDGEAGAFSDHAGVLAELALPTTAAASVPPLDPAALDRAEAALRAGREAARERRRDQRVFAGGAAFTAAVGLSTLREPRETRRHFLRRGALALGALAVPACGGALALSEGFAPQELDAYDALLAELAAARGGSGAASPGWQAQDAISSRRRLPTRSA